MSQPLPMAPHSPRAESVRLVHLEAGSREAGSQSLTPSQAPETDGSAQTWRLSPYTLPSLSLASILHSVSNHTNLLRASCVLSGEPSELADPEVLWSPACTLEGCKTLRKGAVPLMQLGTSGSFAERTLWRQTEESSRLPALASGVSAEPDTQVHEAQSWAGHCIPKHRTSMQ